MKVIVVGCGRLGSDVAYRLFQRGNEVSVVDVNSTAFNNLPADFGGRINEGDALSQDVLHRAGIESADALAAMTNSDPLNAVIGHVARETFHVANVVVRNYDPHSRGVLEAFGFQIISATSWGAQRVEEVICHQDVSTIFSSGNGEIEIYEFLIPPTWNQRRLGDLLVRGITRAVSLSRAGKATLPEDSDVLEDGDVLLISATFEGAEEVRNRLKKQEG